MGRELDELLRATVDRPDRPVDADGIVTASQRRARRRRIGVGAAAALLLVVVGIAGLQLVGSEPGPLEIADQPGGDLPGSEGALEEWPRVTGDPVLTLDAHSEVEPSWWVSVAPGERDRWCAATSLDSPGPRFADLCDQLLPPGQGDVFTVTGSLTTHDGGWLRWGTASHLDDDVELLVRYDDDTTEAVRHASAPELDFWLWTVAYVPELDDREPIGIDIVIDGEVTEHRTFAATDE